MNNLDLIVELLSTTSIKHLTDNEIKIISDYLVLAPNKTHIDLKKILHKIQVNNLNNNYKEFEFVKPGHFYSAIPSIEDRQLVLSKKQEDTISGINISLKKHEKLIKDLVNSYLPYPMVEDKVNKFRYYFNNPAYSYNDAIMLYYMMCKYKPKRYYEIGSGYSSCLALDINEFNFDNKISTIFIEPFPKLLLSLLKKEDNKKIRLIPKKIQDVPLSIFNDLNKNDILFIDSTHVSKLGSDVNHIFNNILPNLQKGVLIHIHDIFWPFEYPRKWIKEGRAWTEL